jgi:hypothetical protein
MKFSKTIFFVFLFFFCVKCTNQSDLSKDSYKADLSKNSLTLQKSPIESKALAFPSISEMTSYVGNSEYLNSAYFPDPRSQEIVDFIWSERRDDLSLTGSQDLASFSKEDYEKIFSPSTVDSPEQAFAYMKPIIQAIHNRTPLSVVGEISLASILSYPLQGSRTPEKDEEIKRRQELINYFRANTGKRQNMLKALPKSEGDLLHLLSSNDPGEHNESLNRLLDVLNDIDSESVRKSHNPDKTSLFYRISNELRLDLIGALSLFFNGLYVQLNPSILLNLSPLTMFSSQNNQNSNPPSIAKDLFFYGGVPVLFSLPFIGKFEGNFFPKKRLHNIGQLTGEMINALSKIPSSILPDPITQHLFFIGKSKKALKALENIKSYEGLNEAFSLSTPLMELARWFLANKAQVIGDFLKCYGEMQALASLADLMESSELPWVMSEFVPKKDVAIESAWNVQLWGSEKITPLGVPNLDQLHLLYAKNASGKTIQTMGLLGSLTYFPQTIGFSPAKKAKIPWVTTSITGHSPFGKEFGVTMSGFQRELYNISRILTQLKSLSAKAHYNKDKERPFVVFVLDEMVRQIPPALSGLFLCALVSWIVALDEIDFCGYMISHIPLFFGLKQDPKASKFIELVGMTSANSENPFQIQKWSPEESQGLYETYRSSLIGDEKFSIPASFLGEIGRPVPEISEWFREFMSINNLELSF